MALVASGLMNKQAAHQLGLSEITVKIHRGNLMRKMEAKSLADLVRMVETLKLRLDDPA
jgi:FixJ family two-component response regulator